MLNLIQYLTMYSVTWRIISPERKMYRNVDRKGFNALRSSLVQGFDTILFHKITQPDKRDSDFCYMEENFSSENFASKCRQKEGKPTFQFFSLFSFLLS